MIIKKFLVSFTVCMLTACNLMGCGIGIDKKGSLGKRIVANENKIVELKGAKKAKVDVNMGVGELRIKDGEEKLMVGEFIYSIPEWKPKVEYEVSNKEGKLKIAQPSSKNNDLKNNEYKWNLAFNKDIPIDMNIECGVAESDIDLSKLNINSLFVKAGVGEVNINLSGNYKQNVKVDIEGGVGSLKIYLPKSMGVRVQADKGIGQIKADGFKKENREYVNDSYGKTKHIIDLNVKVGVGEVEIKQK